MSLHLRPERPHRIQQSLLHLRRIRVKQIAILCVVKDIPLQEVLLLACELIRRDASWRGATTRIIY